MRRIALFCLIVTMLLAGLSPSGVIKPDALAGTGPKLPMVYYPRPQLDKQTTLPFLLFNLDYKTHVRDAKNFQLLKVWDNLDKISPPRILFDDVIVSMLPWGPNKLICYARMFLDGRQEEYEFKNPFMIVWDAVPVNIVEIRDKKGLRTYEAVDGRDRKILWEIKEAQYLQVQFDVLGASLWKTDRSANKTTLIDHRTGKPKFELDGFFDKRYLGEGLVYLSSISIKNKKTFQIIFCVKTNKIVYQYEDTAIPITNHFYVDNGDVINIIPSYYKDKDWLAGFWCKLVRVSQDGTVKENLKFDIKAEMRPFEYLWDISLVYSNLVMVWAFKPSRLLVIDYLNNKVVHEQQMYAPWAQNFGGNIIVNNIQTIMAIDPRDFNTLWEVDAPMAAFIQAETIKDKTYIYNRVYDPVYDDYAVRLKVVNMEDMSVEPYEYFVSPFIGGLGSICPTPYGVVFIPSSIECAKAKGKLELWRPGSKKPLYRLSDQSDWYKRWSYVKDEHKVRLVRGSDSQVFLFDVTSGYLHTTNTIEK